MVVFVDDMVVTWDVPEERAALQTYLSKFEIKDLGPLKYFLGQLKGIFLSECLMNLLTETGMFACKLVDTPIEMNHKLCEHEDQIPTNKEQYQRLIERLIYLAHT